MRLDEDQTLLIHKVVVMAAGALAVLALVALAVIDLRPDPQRQTRTVAPAGETREASLRRTIEPERLRKWETLYDELNRRSDIPGERDESPGDNAADQPESDRPDQDASPWSTDIRVAPLKTDQDDKAGQPKRSASSKRRTMPHSLKSRLVEIGPAALTRLEQRFKDANVAWPPAEIVLVAIKDERALELHARPEGGAFKLVHRYRVLAASGGSGPKLVQGDKQVPEGIYRISYLNPNSAYHVSLRVNYPNAFDRKMARLDGRRKLGGDIMIHGKASSAGCLAIGDSAAEEMFVLAAETGLSNIKVIIAPTDFRRKGLPTLDASKPKWLPKLYTEIAANMSQYKAPPPATGLLSFFMQ